MRIESRPLSEIKPYDGNPRVNDKAVPAVMNSIREFGFRNPVLVDADGVIVAGHTRYLAAQRLELAVVPVVRVDDLTPEQIKAFRIADNQTASLSSWDEKLLGFEWADLRDAGVDADWLGFTDADLAKLLPKPEAANAPDADAVPETPPVPVSCRGEVYRLGNHRLLCGDAADAGDVSRLMGDDRADLLLTDPPYLVNYDGGPKPSVSRKNNALENDALSADDFAAFLSKAFAAANAVMKPGAAFYVWHADRNSLLFRQACEAAGWRVRQELVWIKNIMVIGRQDYHWKHEPCLYGFKDGAKPYFAGAGQTTVFPFDKPVASHDHPTMKPVDLFARHMGNSCPRGGVVLDLFAGSGTTAVVAERLGVMARLVELSPGYCDVIRKRWAEQVHGAGCDWKTIAKTITP